MWLQTEDANLVGPLGEYLVACDFMRRGYHVQVSSLPTLPYDLMVDIKNNFLKIQVKTTAKPGKNGYYNFYLGHKGGTDYVTTGVDLFAFVALDTRQIYYVGCGNIKAKQGFRLPPNRLKQEAEASFSNCLLAAHQ